MHRTAHPTEITILNGSLQMVRRCLLVYTYRQVVGVHGTIAIV